MGHKLCAIVDREGAILFVRVAPAGRVMLGYGFARRLRRSIHAKADRVGASLRVPGFDKAAPEPSIDAFRKRLSAVLTPVPTRIARVGRGERPKAIELPLWRELVDAEAPAPVAALAAAIGATSTSVETRLARWAAAGLVRRSDDRPFRYSLSPDAPASSVPPRVDAGGRASARQSTARDRLWRAMRVLVRFDLPTLLITSGASRRSAEDLINCLHRGGYLRQLRRGNAMTGEWSTYALARNTGPVAPSIVHGTRADGTRFRELVDRNSGERVDIAPAARSLRKAKPDLGDGGVG